MRLLPTLSALLPLLPLSLAQSNYPNQSAPFNLVLSSTNKTLNNAHLSSCHSGAAIESLCLDTNSQDLSSPSSIYFFNSTTDTVPPTGILVWNLQGTGFEESEAMIFQYNPASNLAMPLFFPGSDGAQPVQFDAASGEMGIALTVVDTVAPPYAVDPPQAGYQSLYRWYVCQTYTEGYTYYTLTWKLGNEARPQNPSCHAVTVRRKFVK